MPSNISFLESARDKAPVGSDSAVFKSKVAGILDPSVTPVISPVVEASAYHEAWLPDTGLTPIQAPFQTANNGTVHETPYVSVPFGGTDVPVFAIQATGDDAHLTQYDSSTGMVSRAHPGGYVDDVIWEVSAYARLMVNIDVEFSILGADFNIGGWYFSDSEDLTDLATAQLFIFGCDSDATPFFTNNAGGEVTNLGTNVQNPADNNKTFYYTSTSVGSTDWHHLQMFVKFRTYVDMYQHPITQISMRVDADYNNGGRMAFANVRLQPHNMSLGKIFSVTTLNADDDFTFSSNLDLT